MVVTDSKMTITCWKLLICCGGCMCLELLEVNYWFIDLFFTFNDKTNYCFQLYYKQDLVLRTGGSI